MVAHTPFADNTMIIAGPGTVWDFNMDNFVVFGTGNKVVVTDGATLDNLSIDVGFYAQGETNSFIISKGAKVNLIENFRVAGSYCKVDVADEGTVVDLGRKPIVMSVHNGTYNHHSEFHIRDGAEVGNGSLYCSGGYSAASNMLVKVSGGGKFQTQGDSSLGTWGNFDNMLHVTGEGSEWTHNDDSFKIGLYNQVDNVGIYRTRLLVDDDAVANCHALHIGGGWSWTRMPPGEMTSGNHVKVASGGKLFVRNDLQLSSLYNDQIWSEEVVSRIETHGNFVSVGGGDGRPSLLHMTNKSHVYIGYSHYYNGENGSVQGITGNYLEAAADGMVTNINTIYVGRTGVPSSNNFVRTSGGVVDCKALNITTLNGLGPVVTKDCGTGIINVEDAVEFQPGTYVWPSAEEGAPTGRYRILYSKGGIVNGANITLAPGTDESCWNLRTDADSVWLRHSHPATFIIIR